MRKPNVEEMKAKKDFEGLMKVLKYKGDAYVRHELARALVGRYCPPDIL